NTRPCFISHLLHRDLIDLSVRRLIQCARWKFSRFIRRVHFDWRTLLAASETAERRLPELLIFVGHAHVTLEILTAKRRVSRAFLALCREPEIFTVFLRSELRVLSNRAGNKLRREKLVGRHL